MASHYCCHKCQLLEPDGNKKHLIWHAMLNMQYIAWKAQKLLQGMVKTNL